MPETTPSPERHVAVLAFPFATHAGLLFGLLRRLATASPNTAFSFFSTEKSNGSLFATLVPVNIKPFNVPDGLPEGYVFSGKPQEDIDFFLEVAKEGFRAALARAEAEVGRPVVCVVADAFLWFAAGLAEEVGATWVPLWTSGACSLCTHVYTDFIRETVGTTDISGRENEILKFIPGFSELRLGDLQGGILSGNLESPFSLMLHKMGQTLHKATAVPLNSFEGLEPELNKALSPKFQKILNIGPFNLTSPPQPSSDPYECLPWLDKHGPASVAYLGFGTVATPPPHELAALAEALEATGTPFLWSLREKPRENLPEGFLERTREIGKIVPWAPQVKILEHSSVGVFINHCGWNSVLESIVAGVPLIGRPFFGDHHLNAWMVENVWKIGMRVEGGTFTKNGTISALKLLLKTEKGKYLKDQSEYYKEIALKAVGPQGSSTKNFNALVEVINGN